MTISFFMEFFRRRKDRLLRGLDLIEFVGVVCSGDLLSISQKSQHFVKSIWKPFLYEDIVAPFFSFVRVHRLRNRNTKTRWWRDFFFFLISVQCSWGCNQGSFWHFRITENIEIQQYFRVLRGNFGPWMVSRKKKKLLVPLESARPGRSSK